MRKRSLPLPNAIGAWWIAARIRVGRSSALLPLGTFALDLEYWSGRRTISQDWRHANPWSWPAHDVLLRTEFHPLGTLLG